MEKTCCSRREFCKKSAGLLITAGVAQYSILSCSNKNSTSTQTVTVTVDTALTANQPLQNVGGSVYVDNPLDAGSPVIVYRKSTTQITAFSSKCTHEGQMVGLVDQNGQATCPAHFSVFNDQGQVVSGPAPQNLPAYPATLSGSIITITVTG
jgi:Rieske Fe-S protein